MRRGGLWLAPLAIEKPMIDEPPGRFLMTSAQHRQWAHILRSKGKPEKARRHELLARAIEKIAQREAAPPYNRNRSLEPSSKWKADNKHKRATVARQLARFIERLEQREAERGQILRDWQMLVDGPREIEAR
jgi:hypothetical protein